jgi:hypothetical protein
MNRTLPFLLAVALTLAGISRAGQKVSVDDAVKIAGCHMATLPATSGEGLKSSSSSSSYRFSLTDTAVRGNDTLYYVLTEHLLTDFVILAATAQGTLSLVWDGRDTSGRPCAPSLYF